jgi:pimeloyl-ACP methyl ester carboxylesterase
MCATPANVAIFLRILAAAIVPARTSRVTQAAFDRGRHHHPRQRRPDREVRMSTKTHPIIFIHGLWLHSSSWGPWEDFFRGAGYATTAPGWPGDGETVELTRMTPDGVADFGIDDVVEHYRSIIESQLPSPIVIGHSFGGMIAQKLLGQDRAVAAIAIDAAQIKGVLRLPLSSLRATLPVFKNPANKHKAVMLTAPQFRYSFGNELTEEESDTLHEKWVIPAPARPLFEAATAPITRHSPDEVDTDNPDRGPLLLMMGGKDHIVPESITKSTFKQYQDSPATTELMEFPDRGHSLTIDSGWREIAEASLAWLEKQGL